MDHGADQDHEAWLPDTADRRSVDHSPWVCLHADPGSHPGRDPGSHPGSSHCERLAKGANGSTEAEPALRKRVQERAKGDMSDAECSSEGAKPLFVDKRDGNTLARAITTHLGALRREGRSPAELCVASCYFNPQALELIAREARHVPRSACCSARIDDRAPLPRRAVLR